MYHEPLTRYPKLRVAHAPGMPGTCSPPPTSKETACKRSRHASRHVREAHAVMHVGIANPRWRGKRSGVPGACATCNFAYVVRGPLQPFTDIFRFRNIWLKYTSLRHPGKRLLHMSNLEAYWMETLEVHVDDAGYNMSSLCHASCGLVVAKWHDMGDPAMI